MYTCERLEPKKTSYLECSRVARHSGGVFVSLHIANAVSRPAPWGRLSSKLVLSIKL